MGKSSKVALRLVLAWIVGLGGILTTTPSKATAADEPRDEPVSVLQASGETRIYEDQTGAQVWAVRDGWDLDQYLFRASSPLNFAIDVGRDFGPVDTEGHPAPGNALFGLIGRVTVRVPLGLVHGWEAGERLADVSTYFVDNQVLEEDEIVAPLHTTTNLASGAAEIDPSIEVRWPTPGRITSI